MKTLARSNWLGEGKLSYDILGTTRTVDPGGVGSGSGSGSEGGLGGGTGGDDYLESISGQIRPPRVTLQGTYLNSWPWIIGGV